MLLVTNASAKCVLLDSAFCDERAVALIEKRLGKPVAELAVMAEGASPVMIGGVERVPETIANVLGADRIEQLEYSAYDKVEALLAQSRPGRTRNCILAGYHEFASLITHAMRISAVASSRQAPFIMLVDERLLESIREGSDASNGVQVEDLDTGSRLNFGAPFLKLLARSTRQPAENDEPPAEISRRPAETIFSRARLRLARRRLVRGWRKYGFMLVPKGVVRGLKTVIPMQLRIEAYYARIALRNQVRATWRHLLLLKAIRQERLRMLAAERKSRQQQRAQLLSKENDRSRDAIVMTVQDSGTRVNLDPAMAIAREFKARGVSVIIVTESRLVLNEFTQEGYSAVLLGHGFSGAPLLPTPNPPNQLGESGAGSLAIALPKRFWRYVYRRYREAQSVLSTIDWRIRIAAVLSINETLPVSVSAGLWARARNRPWIGHFPILLGKRADCYYFPADQHLAYGEQLRDHMAGAGVALSAVEVVGSFTYDKHFSRDRKADRLAVEKNFPRASKVKLVTVATENLGECEIELVPVLNAVSAMPGVHVVLKLHPEDSLDYFERLANRLKIRDRIDIVKKYPLGELLCASDLLICVMSNIAIEAGVTGTPTLMCDFSGKTKVLDFAAEGLCIPCKSAGELPGLLEKLLTDESFMNAARERMRTGLRRFNGPNDGRSTQRIVDYVLARAGFARGLGDIASGQPFALGDGGPGAGERGASQDTVTMA